jgi:hypothetical protein
MSTPPADTATAANDIAAQLQESHPPAILQIQRIIERIGIAAAYDFLQQTLAVEAEGGMLIENGKRRRTPGGVYFYIVRGKVTPEIRQALWPRTRSSKSGGRNQAPHPIFPWENRETLAEPALNKKGTATNVKLTLVGRPGKVIDRNDAVIITMTGPKPPSLPKGLPVLPDDAVTIYLVYIAKKQWNKVAPAIQNPEDKLIIEGYPFMDAKLKVIGVLTQSATTVMLQRAQRPKNP